MLVCVLYAVGFVVVRWWLLFMGTKLASAFTGIFTGTTLLEERRIVFYFYKGLPPIYQESVTIPSISSSTLISSRDFEDVHKLAAQHR